MERVDSTDDSDVVGPRAMWEAFISSETPPSPCISTPPPDSCRSLLRMDGAEALCSEGAAVRRWGPRPRRLNEARRRALMV